MTLVADACPDPFADALGTGRGGGAAARRPDLVRRDERRVRRAFRPTRDLTDAAAREQRDRQARSLAQEGWAVRAIDRLDDRQPTIYELDAVLPGGEFPAEDVWPARRFAVEVIDGHTGLKPQPGQVVRARALPDTPPTFFMRFQDGSVATMRGLG